MGTEYLTEVVQRVSDRIRQSVSLHIFENPDHEHNKYAVSHMKEAEDLASAAQALAAKDARISQLEEAVRVLGEEVTAWRSGYISGDGDSYYYPRKELDRVENAGKQTNSNPVAAKAVEP